MKTVSPFEIGGRLTELEDWCDFEFTISDFVKEALNKHIALWFYVTRAATDAGVVDVFDWVEIPSAALNLVYATGRTSFPLFGPYRTYAGKTYKFTNRQPIHVAEIDNLVVRSVDLNRLVPGHKSPPAEIKKIDSTASIFRSAGSFWQVSFQGGQVSQIPNSKGMIYIQELLRKPNSEIPAPELAAASNLDPDSAAKMKSPEIGASDSIRSRLSSPLGSNLDAKARDAYKTKLREIISELAEAERNNDQGQIISLKRERDFLLSQFKGDTLRDKSSENARSSVRQAIMSAVERIGSTNKSLADHLGNYLKMGSNCSYRPGPHPPSWSF